MIKMIIAMIMVSLITLAKFLYVSSTQSARTFKGNPFLYFQCEDFKNFQLFKFQWH